MFPYQIPRRQEVESFLKTNHVMFTYQIPRRFTNVSHRGNSFIEENSWREKKLTILSPISYFIRLVV